MGRLFRPSPPVDPDGPTATSVLSQQLVSQLHRRDEVVVVEVVTFPQKLLTPRQHHMRSKLICTQK